jgi:hypothetical protein
MVSVLASNVVGRGFEPWSGQTKNVVDRGFEPWSGQTKNVDHGFEPWSGQTKDHEFRICCFPLSRQH